jgi:hypothetical protein
VTFTTSDVSQLRADNLFDAVVGRFILMYLDEPAAVLHSASQLLRPGGVVAFQEPSYAPSLLLSEHLPLWYRTVCLVEEVLRRSGANTEMGMALYRTFQQAGLPPPTVAMDIPLGNAPDFIAWASDTLRNLLPQLERLDLPIEALGDLGTLPERLQAEVSTANTTVPWQGVVSAWSRVQLQ